MKSSIPKTSVSSIIKYADGDFYTRYFSPVYDFMTRLSGWRQKISSWALENIKPCRLLDVGCGTGYLMQVAIAKKFEVTGLDASSGMLLQAAKKPGVVPSALILASADKMPFADESFDTVIACGSLVHIPNIDIAAQEMIRVVKKNGLIRVVDHVIPEQRVWNTPIFKVFSELSGDILHVYDQHFEIGCRKEGQKTLGRGGFLQRLDYRRHTR